MRAAAFTAALVIAALPSTLCATNLTERAVTVSEDGIRSNLLSQKQAIANWDQFADQTGITGWDTASAVCDWTGIECLGGSVLDGFALSLGCDNSSDVEGLSFCAANPAYGTLAPELADVPPLLLLDLSNQNIRGTLPPAWGNADSFPELRGLDLSSNFLTGPLPASWAAFSAFPALQLLNLSFNDLSGTLTQGWGNVEGLPALSILDLASNDLTGTLPRAWTSGGFDNLTVLLLPDNLLTGTLPGDWDLPSLSTLDLSQNSLTGTLPDQVHVPDTDPAPALHVLRLARNTLSGTLPPGWGRPEVFSWLELLDLSHNALAGPLPSQWSFQNLRNLSLSHNQLTAAIPPSWGYRTTFPDLQNLDLEGNRLCGSVPIGLLPMCYSTDSFSCPTGGACPPPPAFTSPPPPPGSDPTPAPAPDASSSSTVGIIVGSVVGGLAAVALLVAFAVWRGRSSLRRPVAAPPPPPGKGDLESNLSDEAIIVVGQQSGTDRPSPSDGGLGGGGLPTLARDSTLAELAADFGKRSADLENDPVISFLSSHLATLRGASLARHAARASPAGPGVGDGSRGGGGATLAPEVRQWEVQWGDITIVRPIGRGSFGRVYLASWRQTPVAVKVLTSSDSDSGELREEDFILPEGVVRELQEEATVMTRMRHPSIVSFMGLCLMPPLIVTEFCGRGSLYDVLLRAARLPEAAAQLGWARRLHMALDAARGLLYLHRHSPPIIHRDVKSPNLLVDQHWRVKVADFNLSKIFGAANETDGPSNPMWLAPEVALEDAEATEASDVYSFALVLYELLTWQLPWEGRGPIQISYSLQQGLRPEVPPRIALPGPDTLAFAGLDSYCQLMRDCWAQRPADRPTFEAIIPRLGRLLEGLARASSGAAGRPPHRSTSGAVGIDAGCAPVKRWDTAPIKMEGR